MILLSLNFWIGLAQSVRSLVYLSVLRENLSTVLPIVVHDCGEDTLPGPATLWPFIFWHMAHHLGS